MTFFLDGQILERFNGQPFETWWQLFPGTHQVWAEGTRASGEIITSQVVTFEVVESD